jgi:hypothetical protein
LQTNLVTNKAESQSTVLTLIKKPTAACGWWRLPVYCGGCLFGARFGDLGGGGRADPLERVEASGHSRQNTCPHLHRTLVSRREADRCSSQNPSGYFSTLNGFADTRAFPVAPQFGHRISRSDRSLDMLRISANAFLDQAAIALGYLELM